MGSEHPVYLGYAQRVPKTLQLSANRGTDFAGKFQLAALYQNHVLSV
jgi:hypothetical protein